jgi:type VI secretion system VasD/TssJ family lipoprotein
VLIVTTALRRRFGFTVLLAGWFGGVACSPPTPAEPPAKCDTQVVHVAIIGSPNLNLSSGGESRPVQVRLYQLKNDVTFRNTAFADIWKDDKKALGEDLIGVQEVSVFPDSRVEVEAKRNPEATFLVGAALFREPRGSDWYYTFELPPPPGEAGCRAKKCEGPKCETAPQLDPEFLFWLERSKIDEGSEHQQDQTSRVVTMDGSIKSCPQVAASSDQELKSP